MNKKIIAKCLNQNLKLRKHEPIIEKREVIEIICGRKVKRIANIVVGYKK